MQCKSSDNRVTSQNPHCAVIVAHGQPSDPAPAEAELAALAANVAALLPNWQVTSATLADPNALAAAITGPHGIVYPMFMSGGWFTATHLPERLGAIGAANWHIVPPFGLDPAVQSLTVTIAKEATRDQSQPELLLAAHGSFRSPSPSEVAYAMVRQLQTAGIAHAKAGFIDQSPRIADVARTFGPNAVCLPFFAAKGGHVIDDLPQALAEAGFTGQLLPPVGLDPRVPGLIARALQTAARE
jgi:sirohydrochlorin ferrochelatase